jgi:alanine-glyoxylate transaminase/serine-glyoxylate transaminase/serine-pyruvate transaminase
VSQAPSPTAIPPWEERLFLPGPTPVPWPIAHAMARPMTELRGPALTAVVERVEAGLAAAFGTAGRAVCISATGTAALEAVAQNLFAPGDPVVAVCAGAFGERFARVAELHGLAVTRVDAPYGEVPQAAAVAEAVAATAARGLLMTHNETSTGILMPVAAWTRAARAAAPDLLTVADSISGVPSVPLAMDAIGVDAAVAASQKGFMAPPGFALVALGSRALAALRAERPGRMYFDLNGYVAHHFPSTPAIPLWFALDESLKLLAAEGEGPRYARHVRMGRMIRAAGAAIGMAPLAPEPYASPTVTALAAPDGLTGPQVQRAARRYGAVLAGAMGPWAQRALRVGHVGAITPLDMTGAVCALEAAVLDLGREVGRRPNFTPGAALGAALAILREEEDPQ